jgi:putative ABC transport system permease protein
MQPLAIVRAAASSLVRHKLRSLLTTLGVIIGVAAVIALVAVGNGAQAKVASDIASLGQNLLLVFAGNRRSAGGVSSGLGGAPLTLDDAKAIQREVIGVTGISPEVRTSGQAVANGQNWSTTVIGVSGDYLAIRQWTLSGGVMFTPAEERAVSKLGIIGSKLATQLFGTNVDPIGQTVRIKNIPFLIVGTLTSKGANLGGQDQDDVLLIPYTSAMRRLTGDTTLRTIDVQVGSDGLMNAAQEQIESLLRQRHRLRKDQTNDFNILNQAELAQTAGNITKVLTLLLGAIASVSLVVGGIGIMNIMLVSVTERTREIGIRLAIGAQGRDVLWQFLLEAVLLSCLGGVIGIGIGVGGARLVTVVSGFQTFVSSSAVAFAFGFSAAIGIFFGFYPARKAARLDPIDALRYE